MLDGDKVQTFTEAEVRALLRVTAEHVRGHRDHVIISLALATGLRSMEIAALNFGDLFKVGQRLPRKRVQLRVFKTSNPNPKQQVITLNDRIRKKLALYRERLEAKGIPTGPDDPAFPSNRGKRVSTRTIRHQFSMWQEKAAIDTPLSFHCLRHTSCTNLYRRTRDLRLVQMFARHADIRSTQIYTHPTADDLEAGVSGLAC